ncbi:MAG: hypothetical protein JWN41_1344 [Thermoleophilia bacterium]|nr:hypothetical protein [Thermoleophilia bacterium]
MSYESALQRVSELRTLVDPATGATSTSASTAAPGVFDAELANAQLTQEQAALSMSTPASLTGNADSRSNAINAGLGSSTGLATASTLATPGLSGTAGSGDRSAEPLSKYGLPVLTVADQYRLLGITPPTAGNLSGLSALSPVASSGSTGARMVALAQRELGVSENGSSNDSSRIREYRAATAGAENSPGPWCSYFVSWLAKNAGAPVGAGGNGTGYVPTLEAWGKQQQRWIDHGSQTPQPGDIAIFDWAGDGVADHTGIVERVDADGTVHTIEGNSSNAVNRRQYDASTNDIKGFVRPG